MDNLELFAVAGTGLITSAYVMRLYANNRSTPASQCPNDEGNKSSQAPPQIVSIPGPAASHSCRVQAIRVFLGRESGYLAGSARVV
jgi:hypothetical protein